MDLKKYREIKDQLDTLNRRDGYQLLLLTQEWEDFRNKILALDSDRCTLCERVEGVIEERIPDQEWDILIERDKKSHDEFWDWFINDIKELSGFDWKKPPYKLRLYRYRDVGRIILQIHHSLYFWNKLPWEYDKSHVRTLCQDCHKTVHQTTRIYTYLDETMKSRKEFITCEKCSGTGYLAEFSHRDNGVCYDCGGIGLLNDGAPDWQLTT